MKRIVGLVIGLFAFFFVLSVDIPVGVAAHRLAAVASLVIVFWITEPVPIPVTALLGSVLCIGLGVAPVGEVVAPYSDPIIFLFIGAFLVGEAMVSTGLDRRVASAVMSVPALSATPVRLVATIGLLTMAMSMWMSNTAATAVIMPLAMSALRVGPKTRLAGGGASVLTVAYSASIGGVATPIGTPPNLIAVGYLGRHMGEQLSFAYWMKIALPLSMVLMAILLCLSWIALRKTRGRQKDTGERPGRKEPWTRAQKTVFWVLGLMVAAWLTPSLLKFVVSEETAQLVKGRIPSASVALSGAIALFALPSGKGPCKPILELRQLKRIDWGTILLFGGGLSLGVLVLDTGLGEWLGSMALDATGVKSQVGLIALSVLTATVLSEFMSNTAATNMIIPMVIAMSVKLGLSPVPAVMAVAFGASMAFTMPVSTPPNAIAYGTGEVTIIQMIRRGLGLDVLSFFTITGWLALVFVW